ncbi:NPCBM/NEW2 domain-containing protein [Ligilactobacillus ceti]|uniref:F5 8 type C domain protein n=1 Tax=Ligilactobacillus ceti DSM 22408 TaxID=1122146 RepID=A0A0R2KNK8_9LACO|nr:NPCBM/NEW2 domain-containing protein [Ligilactobacillus ceti]KRN88981.1 F5 8 type C domain protein [Ligilactobacillus ceti DSM 22408]
MKLDKRKLQNQFSFILGMNLLVLGAKTSVVLADNTTDINNKKPITMLSQTMDEVQTLKVQPSVKNEVYLSNLTPRFVHVGWSSLKKDTNLSGKPIELKVNGKDKIFKKGITAHADAKLIYQIPKNVNVFETYLGVDDHQNGTVEFKLYLDNDLVYTSGHVNRNNTKHIKLNVTGKKELKVMIDTVGSASQDHSMLAGAEFYQQDLSGYDLSQLNVQEPKFSFGALKNGNYRLTQAQAEFIKDLGKVNLFTFLTENEKNHHFLEWLLNNETMLDYYNHGLDPRGNNKIGFLNQLQRIVTKDASAKTNPMNQKIAMAVALEYANDDISLWINANAKSDAVRRYEIYRDLNNTPGQLRPIFKTLDVDLMRNVVSARLSDEDLLWIRAKVQKEHPELLTSNSQLSNIVYKYIAYNPFNKYGDDVQRPNYYGENPSLAKVIELGGVCGSISKFDESVLRAFGVPANLVGQPGHAAVTYMKDDGNWSRNNNISSWGRTQGGTATTLAQGSQGFNNTYNLLDFAARQNPQNYYLAKEYYGIYQQTTDYQIKTALAEKILELEPLFVPIYRDKLSELEQQAQANPQMYHDLAIRIIQNFRNFPKPMLDLLKPVMNHLKGAENRRLVFDVAVKYSQMVQQMSDPYAKDVFQEEEYQKQAQEFMTMLGSFSLNGPNKNRLMGSKTDTEYSLDGGISYIPITDENQMLLTSDVAKITAKNGILLRLKGMTEALQIKFTQKNIPDSVHVDDQANQIIGLKPDMEYSLDQGKSWLAGSVPADLSGEKTVLVRYQNTGTTLGGDVKTLQFTPNKELYRNIYRDNINLLHWTSQQNDTDQSAKNVLDGDSNTIWHTVWNRGDHTPALTFQFNHKYPVQTIWYTPRQDSGTNGNIEDYTIYTSQDGQHFTKVLSGHFTYTHANRKQRRAIQLPTDLAPTQYLKLEINHGVNNFGSAAEISFEITKQAAQAEKNERAQQITQAAQKDLQAQLKALIPNVSVVSDLTNNADIKAKLQSLTQAIRAEQQKKVLSEKNIVQFKIQLDTLRNQVILDQMEHSIIQTSPAFAEFMQQYQTVFQPQILPITKDIATQIKAGLAAFAKLSAADQQKFAYLKVNLLTKQNEYLVGVQAQVFKQTFKKMISLTEKTVQERDYNNLNEAYYNSFALSDAAQAGLVQEQIHLKRLIDYLDNQQAEFIKEAEQYKQANQRVLNVDLSKINPDNQSEYQHLVNNAQNDYVYLPKQVQKLLVAEQTQLDKVKAVLAELAVKQAREKLVQAIQNEEQSFAKTPTYQAIWQQSLTKARVVLQTKTPTKAVYDQGVLDLMKAKASLEYQIALQKDEKFRADQFKERFKTLLLKPLDQIVPADQKQLDKAEDQFRRLDQVSQSYLVAERNKLAEIQAKLKPEGQKQLTQVIAKIKAAQKEKTTLAQFKPALQSLLNKAQSTKQHKAQASVALIAELGKILQDNSDLNQKIQLEKIYFEKIDHLTVDNVRLADEALLVAGQQHLKQITKDVKPLIEADRLAQHMQMLLNKIAKIKQNHKQTEYAQLQDAKQMFSLKVRALKGLSITEQNEYLDNIQKSDNVDDIKQLYTQAQNKAQLHKTDEQAQKDALLRELNQDLQKIDVAKLTGGDLAEFQALAHTAKNLQNYNLRDLKQHVQRIQQDLVKLQQRQVEKEQQQAKKAAYQKVAQEVQAELTKVSQQQTKVKEPYATQLKDVANELKVALNLGLTTDQLQTKLKQAQNKVEQIVQANQKATAEEAQKAALKLAQTEAIKTIKQMVDLTTAEQTTYIKQVQNAQSSSLVDNILQDAKKQAQKNQQESADKIAQAKAQQARIRLAQDQIKQLTDLTEQQQMHYQKELAQTTTISQIKQLVTDAKKQAQKNQIAKQQAAQKKRHEENVKQATAIIEKLNGLTDEEKTKYINDLIDCEVGCDTNLILEQAKAQAQANLAQTTNPQQPTDSNHNKPTKDQTTDSTILTPTDHVQNQPNGSSPTTDQKNSEHSQNSVSEQLTNEHILIGSEVSHDRHGAVKDKSVVQNKEHHQEATEKHGETDHKHHGQLPLDGERVTSRILGGVLVGLSLLLAFFGYKKIRSKED